MTTTDAVETGMIAYWLIRKSDARSVRPNQKNDTVAIRRMVGTSHGLSGPFSP